MTNELIVFLLSIGFVFGLFIAWCLAVIVLFPQRRYAMEGES